MGMFAACGQASRESKLHSSFCAILRPSRTGRSASGVGQRVLGDQAASRYLLCQMKPSAAQWTLNRDEFAGDQIVSNSVEHIREWKVTPRPSTGLETVLIFPQHHETRPTQNDTFP
jgi:hypothetical protein